MNLTKMTIDTGWKDKRFTKGWDATFVWRTITLVRVISTASLCKVTTPVIHQETCAEHRTGENCDTCQEECNVKCIAVEGR